MKKSSIFISYSHQDETYKDRFTTYMKSANLPGAFKAWSDRDIEIGSSWEQEIFEAINLAKAAVLLVSENFLSSDYIMHKEIPRIIERFNKGQMTIYPILIKPCPWTEHKWLSPTQILPRDNVSLQEMSEKDQSKEFTHIVSDIKKLLFPKISDPQPRHCTAATSIKKILPQKSKKRTKNIIYYNMDRREQIEAIEKCFRDFASKKPSPHFAWIFHGNDHHAPIKFLDLLKNVWLPEYLTPNLLILDNINWPAKQGSLKNIENSILYEINKQIAKEISFQSDISFESISQTLNQHKGPLIIECVIYSQQWEKNSKENIECFLNIFEKWPERFHGPLIVILTIIYLDSAPPQQSQKKGIKAWFRKKAPEDPNSRIRESLQHISFEKFNYTKAHLFDEFSLIEYPDVKHWANTDAVKHMDDDDQLEDIIDQLYTPQKTAYPVKKLVKAIRDKFETKGT